MSFGLPCPAELWASPARPSLLGPGTAPPTHLSPILLLLWAPCLSLSWRRHSPQGCSSGFLTT